MPQATVVVGALLFAFVMWVIVNGKAKTYLAMVGL
jgi:hypothetical protein